LDTGDTSLIDKMPPALMSDTEREWVKYIRDNVSLYGETPSTTDFINKFPLFIDLPYTEVGLLKRTIEKKKKAAINETLASIDPNNLEESRKTVEELRDKLSMGPSELMNLAHASRVDMYSTSFNTHFIVTKEVTDKLNGLRDGEVLTIIGKYGSGKSLLIENSIVKWVKNGQRVLVISNDMSSTATAMRLDSFLVHQDISQMKQEHLAVLDKVLAMLYSYLDGEIIMPTTPIQYVSEIVGIAKQQKADILVVDGAYLVKSEASNGKGSRDWQAISDTSGELTWLAHSLNIPVVLVSQANRQGDVAYSNSLAQDSDILLKLDEEESIVSDDETVKIMQLSTMKNRRGSPYRGHIQIDFTDFSISDTKFKVGP